MHKNTIRFISGFGALVGWFAIVTQLYLQISNRTTSVPEAIFRYFGYFTIDTNILVAISFTCIFFQKKTKFGILFTKATTISAITVYITIVGIVYNLILRATWNPQGLQKIVDEILHSVTPVLFILYWAVYVPIEHLRWKNAFPWMIFPLLYSAYGAIHGAISGFYPYYFVNVTELGYEKALLNTAGILLGIFVLSLALIGAGKMMKMFKIS